VHETREIIHIQSVGKQKQHKKSKSNEKKEAKMAKGASASVATTFTHSPSSLVLFWFAFSLPLIVWDSVYVFLRPRTMEGGDLHWPLWVPYKLYGEVDHVYGWKAFNANSGFTGAQSFMNIVESLMYVYYAVVYYQNSVKVGGKKVIVGRKAAAAVLIVFSAAVMTVSKTVLYCEFSLPFFLFCFDLSSGCLDIVSCLYCVSACLSGTTCNRGLKIPEKVIALTV